MRTIEEAIKNHKHICWYPSAGSDLRALLFLSDWYYTKHQVPLVEGQHLPDLFVLTDIFGLNDMFRPWETTENTGAHFHLNNCSLGACILYASYMGRYTKITVTGLEELRNHGFTFNPEMTFLKRSHTYNSAFLLEVEVESKKYGIVNKYTTNVLYIAVQNEFFIKEFLVPNKTIVEYQVLVRYGRDPKISRSEELPPKIIRSYKERGTKYLISNEEYVLDAFPDGFVEPIYSINGRQWSGYGAVNWYRLTDKIRNKYE